MIGKLGRPQTHPVKKMIGFADEMVDAVEKWRRKEKPAPTFSEAVRRLIEHGLEAQKKAGKR
jgi:hypothetical protein